MKMIKAAAIASAIGVTTLAIALAGGTTGSNPPSTEKPEVKPEVKRVITPLEGDLKPGNTVIIPVVEKPKLAEKVPELPEPEDLALSDKIHDAMKEDAAFAKIADVDNVSCEEGTCKIMAEAKGEDNSAVFMGVITFLQNHPEYGQKFSKEDVKDNPRAALVTITRE